MASGKDEYIPTIPDDPALLAAIAKVAVNHGYHDLELKMALKSILKLKPQEARRKYHRKTSGVLRSLLREAATKGGLSAGAMKRLNSFLRRSTAATNKRNDTVHGFWCLYKGKKRLVHVHTDGTLWPTPRKLENLAAKLSSLADEMEYARRYGWLKKALDKIATS